MMALLMKSFLSWFKTSKNLVILAYSISALTLAIYLAFTLFFAATTLLDAPAEIRTSPPRIPFFIAGSIGSILHNIHNLLSILSFSILWVSTVLLLHPLLRKSRQAKVLDNCHSSACVFSQSVSHIILGCIQSTNNGKSHLLRVSTDYCLYIKQTCRRHSVWNCFLDNIKGYAPYNSSQGLSYDLGSRVCLTIYF